VNIVVEDKKRQNLRTLLVLASIALCFFVGFIVKTWLFGW
jgi:hypothetical protein